MDVEAIKAAILERSAYAEPLAFLSVNAHIQRQVFYIFF